MRELLEEERALVRAFQKRQRELAGGELQGEREGSKRRIHELDAEIKMLKSLGQTQADEVAQATALKYSSVVGTCDMRFDVYCLRSAIHVVCSA